MTSSSESNIVGIIQWDYYHSCVPLSRVIHNFRTTGAAKKKKKKGTLKRICKTVAGYIYKFSAEKCIWIHWNLTKNLVSLFITISLRLHYKWRTKGKAKVPAVQLASTNLCESPSVWFIAYSSELWGLRKHLHCKESWDHPLDDHIQILLQLGLVILEMKVDSSMKWESQTASFSLQHRLQDSLLGLPQPWKMMPF